ncbi:hypothetical protein ACH5RR_039852 [Cinchona calisaya]|uniref:Uncharacterized protein n=1 Tax=Cinchona calisaya TaxID=153742 RepID=A0ABD2XZH3_9GENT
MFTEVIPACFDIGRKTLLYEYTWLESVLNDIDNMNFSHRSRFGDELHDQVGAVIQELENLRTFAICTAGSHGKLVVGETWWFGRRKSMIMTNLPSPIDVCCRFEEALRKATSEIRRALKKRKKDNECLSKAVSKLQDTMEIFRPKIVKAYGYLSTHLSIELLQLQEDDNSIGSFPWTELFCSFWRGMRNLIYQDEGEGHGQFWLPVKVPLEALTGINGCLLRFLLQDGSRIEVPTTADCNALMCHFASAFVRAAYFSYSWRWMWMDDKDDQMDQKTLSVEEFVIVMDLLKQVMPKTPEAIDTCIQILRASNSLIEPVVYDFVHLLIPYGADRIGFEFTTFRAGLIWLITFLTNAPDVYDDDDGDDVKLHWLVN